MFGILGNFNRVVKPWYLPLDFVFARVTDTDFATYYRAKVIIVRNSAVPNVYATPVMIVDGKVVGLWPAKPVK